MAQTKPASKPLVINHATAIAAARLYVIPMILRNLIGCSDELLKIAAAESTQFLKHIEEESPEGFATIVSEASEALIGSLPDLEEEGMDLKKAIETLKQQ